MQYFAFYNDNGGFYAATHDETGSVKNIFVNTYKEKNICELIIDFPAINMGRGANSFKLPGKMVWQNLCGDWYDASKSETLSFLCKHYNSNRYFDFDCYSLAWDEKSFYSDRGYKIIEWD